MEAERAPSAKSWVRMLQHGWVSTVRSGGCHAKAPVTILLPTSIQARLHLVLVPMRPKDPKRL